MEPMRILNARALLLVLPSLLTLGLCLGSGVSPLGAEEPPKKPADAPKEGGAEEGDDDPEDFFDGDTSFSPKQVSIAIDKGVNWLRKKQDREGSWGPLGAGNRAYGGGESQGQGYLFPSGPTSLALYTLLKCKVPANDNIVKKGFAWLKNENHDKPGSSYELSMLLLAVTATADQAKTLKASDKAVAKDKLSGPMRAWAQTLVSELLDRRKAKGWRYQVQGAQNGEEEDISSTQLAALALFAAHRAGIKVKSGIWEDILEFSMAQQDETGPEVTWEDPLTKAKEVHKARGFAYLRAMNDSEFNRSVGSMTACGVGNVMMARYILSDAGRKRAEWDLRPDAKKVQESVYDGLAWLDHNWSPFANPLKGNADVYHMYWLYSFERMMDLIGKQLLGKHPWYSEMGQQILNKQKEDGSWDTESTHEPQDTLDTCFALLFLKRATRGAIPNPSVTGGSDDGPVDNR
jgi:hypothetical protein